MVDSQYQKGYLAGYRDGIIAAIQGNAKENFSSDLSVEVMQISTRAKNCLIRAGCNYISEVAKLSDERIATMRNLGPKSASKIAQWLDQHGISYSAWFKYL